MPKCLILAPLWHLAVPEMTAEITQVSPKIASENSWGDYYLRTCSQGRCRIASGHQSDRFWMHLGWILDGFLMFFNRFWMDSDTIVQDFGYSSAAAFTECQRRAGTKRTNGKRQTRVLL